MMTRWAWFAMAALLLVGSQAFAVSEISRDVRVEDVRASGDYVRGRLANLEDAELRDIRLLITHTFYWADEMHPGDESPSRTDIFTIDGPIAPRGDLAFEEKLVPPLPMRSDGHFTTSVEVLGFTKIGP